MQGSLSLLDSQSESQYSVLAAQVPPGELEEAQVAADKSEIPIPRSTVSKFMDTDAAKMAFIAFDLCMLYLTAYSTLKAGIEMWRVHKRVYASVIWSMLGCGPTIQYIASSASSAPWTWYEAMTVIIRRALLIEPITIMCSAWSVFASTPQGVQEESWDAHTFRISAEQVTHLQVFHDQIKVIARGQLYETLVTTSVSYVVLVVDPDAALLQSLIITGMSTAYRLMKIDLASEQSDLVPINGIKQGLLRSDEESLNVPMISGLLEPSMANTKDCLMALLIFLFRFVEFGSSTGALAVFHNTLKVSYDASFCLAGPALALGFAAATYIAMIFAGGKRQIDVFQNIFSFSGPLLLPWTCPFAGAPAAYYFALRGVYLAFALGLVALHGEIKSVRAMEVVAMSVLGTIFLLFFRCGVTQKAPKAVQEGVTSAVDLTGKVLPDELRDHADFLHKAYGLYPQLEHEAIPESCALAKAQPDGDFWMVTGPLKAWPLLEFENAKVWHRGERPEQAAVIVLDYDWQVQTEDECRQLDIDIESMTDVEHLVYTMKRPGEVPPKSTTTLMIGCQISSKDKAEWEAKVLTMQPALKQIWYLMKRADETPPSYTTHLVLDAHCEIKSVEEGRNLGRLKHVRSLQATGGWECGFRNEKAFSAFVDTVIEHGQVQLEHLSIRDHMYLVSEMATFSLEKLLSRMPLKGTVHLAEGMAAPLPWHPRGRDGAWAKSVTLRGEFGRLSTSKGHQGLKIIATCFTNVTNFDLSFTSMKAHDLKVMVEHLPPNTAIESFQVSGCEEDGGLLGEEQGVTAFVDLMSKSPNMKMIDLSMGAVSIEGLELLAKQLPHNLALEVINVTNNMGLLEGRRGIGALKVLQMKSPMLCCIEAFNGTGLTRDSASELGQVVQ